ncbi:DEP domain-containing protein 1A-like protein [Dinothrombium tinctorium]|uniref:DEP domain-containing protein 1A-like protein n=1 Tax=Dinothrombium tinctorium TaxID=1965070 RepID=A0A3S3P851_9ACAR|nr:DEP domain-containing protein 1A-like protein [Dinothrombium tinctorium]RWS09951.1 DEP domain-containing protein 1A-like protein [Dinothrombium tinctorium]RWS15460.1 DEP domain-containing protein 1A-like protein [Dinothrombium tinctorium]
MSVSNECSSSRIRRKSLFDQPFYATKLWNEIVCSFCSGIPLKTYRRRFKTYRHCFLACKAIDWMYDYLKQHQVQKTIKLLRKFVKCGIIEKVNAKDCNYELRDNRDLYQLKGKV